MADSSGSQTCVGGWQDRHIYTVETGRCYSQSWCWFIVSTGPMAIANASVEFACVPSTFLSLTSVNPRLAVDPAGRIATDTLSLLGVVTLNLAVTQYILKKIFNLYVCGSQASRILQGLSLVEHMLLNPGIREAEAGGSV